MDEKACRDLEKSSKGALVERTGIFYWRKI
jgi:hypothetical protein